MTNRPINALFLQKLLRFPDIRPSRTGETLSGNTKFLKEFGLEQDV